MKGYHCTQKLIENFCGVTRPPGKGATRLERHGHPIVPSRMWELGSIFEIRLKAENYFEFIIHEIKIELNYGYLTIFPCLNDLAPKNLP